MTTDISALLIRFKQVYHPEFSRNLTLFEHIMMRMIRIGDSHVL